MVKDGIQKADGAVMANITFCRCGYMLRVLAQGNGAIVAVAAGSTGLIMCKRDYERQPGSGVVTGFAAVCANGMAGGFVCAAMATGGSTRCRISFVMRERQYNRQPNIRAMARIAGIRG